MQQYQLHADAQRQLNQLQLLQPPEELTRELDAIKAKLIFKVRRCVSEQIESTGYGIRITE